MRARTQITPVASCVEVGGLKIGSLFRGTDLLKDHVCILMLVPMEGDFRALSLTDGEWYHINPLAKVVPLEITDISAREVPV